MDETAIALLTNAYNINITACRPVTGGWSAFAYRLETDAGAFFLKVYDKNRHTAVPWIKKIDRYMPLLSHLNGYEPVRGFIPAPLCTPSGAHKAESDNYVYLLFQYIDGTTLSETHIDSRQTASLAHTLAHLHRFEVPKPQCYDIEREDFQVPFGPGINQMVGNSDLPDDMWQIFSAHRDKLNARISQVQTLSERLRADPPPFVLCHTDVHGWNLMQSEHLVLIDWEGVRLAPAEAVLFAFTPGFFFDYAQERFMDEYKRANPDYRKNADALPFYRIRRRLEDIHDFAAGILYDELSDEDRKLSLGHLSRECNSL